MYQLQDLKSTVGMCQSHEKNGKLTTLSLFCLHYFIFKCYRGLRFKLQLAVFINSSVFLDLGNVTPFLAPPTGILNLIMMAPGKT